MCINLTQRSPKIAKEDIVAYKVLEVQSDFIFTPYRYMPITFNKLYTDTKQERQDFNRITSGIYHLFSSIEDATLLKKYAEKNYSKESKFIIVKAIIPKGTKYYIGKSEIGIESDEKMFQHESYGAKSVIYRELNA